MASSASPYSLAWLVVAAVVVVVLLTRLFTTIRFHLRTRRAASPTVPQAPPPLPYTLPFFGLAFQWLAPRPGLFWHNVFARYPSLHQSGACQLRLAHQKVNVLFSPTAVNHMFRAPLHRYKFNNLLLTTALGASQDDAKRHASLEDKTKDPETGMTNLEYQEQANVHYLLRPSAVNELTAEFVSRLGDLLAGEDESQEVRLYEWLRASMFRASTDAFMGTGMLDMIPDLERDFFEFDKGFLTMFYGVPRWMSSRAYDVRDSLLDRLEAWQKATRQTTWPPADPAGNVQWEPRWGSRANRARQLFYERVGMTFRGRASLDLGFLFAASSNVIPATGWMLLHLLDPKLDQSVLPRVMDELETARLPDGTLDIAVLVALPLMTSIYHEVLRLYIDVLVTRELDRDVTLPLGEGKNPRTTLLRKGGIVFAPSWLGHRNAESWATPAPANAFCADRFLRADPDTGKAVFSTQGSLGKLFPFGGGKTICPGRVFAKQEVLGSVASVLLDFELEACGFVDDKGKPTDDFPGMREGFTGNGTVAMGGDMRVKMRRKNSAAVKTA